MPMLGLGNTCRQPGMAAWLTAGMEESQAEAGPSSGVLQATMLVPVDRLAGGGHGEDTM